ncbi:hypothetical protein V6574_18350 [Streptomyces sp. SM1P]
MSSEQRPPSPPVVPAAGPAHPSAGPVARRRFLDAVPGTMVRVMDEDAVQHTVFDPALKQFPNAFRTADPVFPPPRPPGPGSGPGPRY